MADAPKTDGGGGGMGFFQAAIAIFGILALLSVAKNTPNTNTDTANTDSQQQTTTTGLTTTFGDATNSATPCALVLDHPVAFEYTGATRVRIAGKLTNCNTADQNTAFYLQVIDGNGTPITEYTAIPIIENTGTELTFNMYVPFTTKPPTKRGTALFMPNVPAGTPAGTIRVPIVFKK